MNKSDISETFKELEQLFFSKEFCSNSKKLDELLSKKFYEFGKSGCIHDRQATIESLSKLTRNRQITISNFTAELIANDITLIHYRARFDTDNTESLRTSIWIMEGDKWKMYFHQGTPITRTCPL